MSYETVAIRSHGWEAQIAPTYGANPVSLQHHGQDILVPWSEDIRDPFLCGAPLLLRTCCDGQLGFDDLA